MNRYTFKGSNSSVVISCLPSQQRSTIKVAPSVMLRQEQILSVNSGSLFRYPWKETGRPEIKKVDSLFYKVQRIENGGLAMYFVTDYSRNSSVLTIFKCIRIKCSDIGVSPARTFSIIYLKGKNTGKLAPRL